MKTPTQLSKIVRVVATLGMLATSFALAAAPLPVHITHHGATGHVSGRIAKRFGDDFGAYAGRIAHGDEQGFIHGGVHIGCNSWPDSP